MGKGLQIRVVAEGVETREQLAFLRKRGCPEGQGYYFSRPVSASEFTQLLRRSATKSRVPAGGAVRKSLLGSCG
ncbi:MAG TPA: EAL domain-containing protein, partial [Steroidobacteraceae bacterium]